MKNKACKVHVTLKKKSGQRFWKAVSTSELNTLSIFMFLFLFVLKMCPVVVFHMILILQ